MTYIGIAPLTSGTATNSFTVTRTGYWYFRAHCAYNTDASIRILLNGVDQTGFNTISGVDSHNSDLNVALGPILLTAGVDTVSAGGSQGTYLIEYVYIPTPGNSQ